MQNAPAHMASPYTLLYNTLQQADHHLMLWRHKNERLRSALYNQFHLSVKVYHVNE